MTTPPQLPPPPATPTPTPRRSRAVWWIGGTLALLLVVCLAAAIGGGDSGRDTTDATDTSPADRADTTSETDRDEDAEPEEPAEPEGIGAGTWEVGGDIEPGTYVTTAPDGDVFDGCYWARLSGFSGEFDELITNANIAAGARGRVTILDSDAGIEFTGDCQWELASNETNAPVGDDVGAGVWEVGTEVEPGIYTTTAPGDDILDGCYWARLAGFTGDFGELITNDNVEGGASGRVEISSSDTGIEFSGDCVWTRS